MDKVDLRIVKSKKAIKNAFLELMKEKGYANITVKDIADRALVNRKTFYMHYETKLALYNEICLSLLDSLAPEPLAENIQCARGEKRKKIVVNMLLSVRKEKDTYLILMNDETNCDFVNMLKEKISSDLLSKFHIYERSKEELIAPDLLIEVYQSLFVILLKWWLKNDNKDPELVIELILQFFSKKPLELLGISF